MKPILASIAALLLCAAASTASADTKTIKIATAAPEGTTWLKEIRLAAEQVKQRTEGRVELKYYPGSVMGNDAAVLRKIKLGQLQGGMLTSSDLATVYNDAPIYCLPFLFDNWAQVDKVRAQVDPLLAKGFDAHGMHMLAASNIEAHYRVDPDLFSPRADYLLRVAGLSMRDAGIQDGDLLAVHRTAEARSGQIVVARLSGLSGDEVTVKRLKRRGRDVLLVAENPDFEPIVVDPRRTAFAIEGVAVGIVRRNSGW